MSKFFSIELTMETKTYLVEVDDSEGSDEAVQAVVDCSHDDWTNIDSVEASGDPKFHTDDLYDVVLRK